MKPPSRAYEGRTVIVTGGNSGIGRAAALRFAEEGAAVVISARRADACAAVAAEIAAKGGRALAVPTDVRDESQIEAMVDRAIGAFGAVHAAFNNAGAGGVTAVHECPRELWDEIIDTNLTGVFLCMKHEIRAMLASGGGAIVNNSSAAGLVGHSMSAPYSASKHGVIGLTKSAGLHYVKLGIRVNAVCPGVVGTPMVTRAASEAPAGMEWFLAKQPGGAAGAPVDVAELVLWLCSDAARFVTGAAVPVDGGMIAGFW